MQIVSWTLAGPGTEDIIGDALRSVVPIVNDLMIVCTDPRGGVEALACDVCDAARKVSPDATICAWKWRDDFGAARNAALGYVKGLATWGLMIDTDERVICPDPEELRAFIAALPPHIEVALVRADDGSHARERFFRLPTKYRFVGRTHEQYHAPPESQAMVPPELCTWSELPKTREQLRAKFLRDIEMLREDIERCAHEGASHHYLGVTLQSLAAFAREDGDLATSRDYLLRALDAYREHRRIDTTGAPAWHEGTAWSCYRAAECYLALGQHDRAIDAAVAGLVLDAGIGELYWIAGIASLRAGRPEQARAWAMSAKAHGMGSESERRRRGFRVPLGLTTGPDEVIFNAHLAIESAGGAVFHLHASASFDVPKTWA